MLPRRLILRSDRVRRTPERFSWLDQRLVREGHLRCLSPHGGMLYLFLLTVSDVHGVSWYSARRICLETGLSFEGLAGARSELVAKDLVAFEDGLYQVLELPKPAAALPARGPGRGDIGSGERAATPEEVSGIVAGFREKAGRS